MAKTYDASTLSSSSKNQIRMLVGDNVSGSMILDDDEISFVLTQQTNVGYAAAVCADLLASYWARYVDTGHGKMNVSASQRFAHYKALAADLRSRAAAGAFSGKTHIPADVHFGGIAEADKNTLDEDTGLVQPVFKRGMDEHPGSFTNAPIGDEDW